MFAPEPKKAPVPPPAPSAEEAAPARTTPSPSAPLPQAVPSTEQLSLEPAPQAQPLEPAGIIPEKPPVEITTDLFTAVLSSTQAGFQSFKLHNYKEKINAPPVVSALKNMFSSGAGAQKDPLVNAPKELIHVEKLAVLPLRTAFIRAGGTAPSDNSVWQAQSEKINLDESTPQGSLVFSKKDRTGLKSTKRFDISNDKYKINFTLGLTNESDIVQQGNAVLEWTAHIPKNGGGGFFGGDPYNITQFVYFIKDSVEKKELKKIEEEMILEGDIKWTSIEEKYFTSVIIPAEPKPLQIRIRKLSEETVAYQLIYPISVLHPGTEAKYTCSLYIGPKDMDILKAQDARLEKTVDFGWFDIISKPLLVSLKFFYKYLGNYGLAIILLTIIIKLLFWPLTHKSFSSMKGMQQIQPEMKKLQEKYKDNKEELARQQMGLYKKYKVNPLGGCLPMLLQIPVFIALYRGLMDSIELRHASFIPFWINDLSAKDPTYIAPLVMGASMLLQQKMTPTSADPTQAKMMMFMPIIFTVMFLNFPSGLVIYWLVNNLISIAQQLYINKKSNDPGGTECTQSKSKQKPSKKR